MFVSKKERERNKREREIRERERKKKICIEIVHFFEGAKSIMVH